MSAFAAAAIGATFLVVAPSVPAFAAESLPAWCTSTGELKAADLPSTLPAYQGCDMTGRLVRDGAAVLAIQPAGTGVAIDGVGEKGLDLSLATLTDGSVVIGRESKDNGNVAVPSGVHNPLNPDPCAPATASAYNLAGWKAYSTIAWYYNSSGVPSNVASSAGSAFSQAGFAMMDGHNDCGVTSVPRDSFQRWDGSTSAAPASNPTSCGGNDGVSVIGWGAMGTTSGVLAVTCTWFQTDVSPWRAVASDMKYNTSYGWTTDVLTCVGAVNVGNYDLKSIATHEWGHAFGLNHVSESGATSSQTMSTNSDGTCQDNEATLGRGDLNGMFSLYGVI